jgi:hypothetical protein
MLTRLTSLRVVASLALPFVMALATVVLASALFIKDARIGMPQSPAQVIVLDDLYGSGGNGFGG